MTFIYGLSCIIGQNKPQILNDYIMRKYRNKNVCEISVLIHPLTKLCLHVITRQITIDKGHTLYCIYKLKIFRFLNPLTFQT